MPRRLLTWGELVMAHPLIPGLLPPRGGAVSVSLITWPLESRTGLFPH